MTPRQRITVLRGLRLSAESAQRALDRLSKSGGRTAATTNAIDRHTQELADIESARAAFCALVVPEIAGID